MSINEKKSVENPREQREGRKTAQEQPKPPVSIEERLVGTKAALGQTKEHITKTIRSIGDTVQQLDKTRETLGLQPLQSDPSSISHNKAHLERLGFAKLELESQENILNAQRLIEQSGGIIDFQTKPYKKFDTTKHERFLIQKGETEGRVAVFKVGGTVDEKTIRDESRNLRMIKQASVKPGASLDAHFVRQVGDVYKNENMVGLATEYVQDDPELKHTLTGSQKIAVIENVIDNLQKLSVPVTVRESGLSIHDGKTIVRDSQFYLGELVREGRLDPATAHVLQKKFEEAATSLGREESVFVHGDAHGDNIFLQKTADGTLDATLLDFEGLRVSNRYHDWSELLNKSSFLKHIQKEQPALFEPIKKNVEHMWLDESVAFNEDEIIEHVSNGDPEKARNFRLTRMYDMLTRIMHNRSTSNPLAQARVELYLEQLKKAAEHVS